MGNKKSLVLDTIDDIIGDLVYYDRKEDEELGTGEIEEMLVNGDLTVQEMVDHFSLKLNDAFVDLDIPVNK